MRTTIELHMPRQATTEIMSNWPYLEVTVQGVDFRHGFPSGGVQKGTGNGRRSTRVWWVDFCRCGQAAHVSAFLRSRQLTWCVNGVNVMGCIGGALVK